MARDLAAALGDAGVTEVMRRVRQARREEVERRQEEEAEARKPLRNWLMYPYAFECVQPHRVRMWTGLIFRYFDYCTWTDAEEAVAQAIYELACIRELSTAPRDDIGALVYHYAQYNVKQAARDNSRTRSIEWTLEERGDVFAEATLVVPLEVRQAKHRAAPVSQDRTARRWTRASIREAFRDYFQQEGKPPSARECDSSSALPPVASVTKFYATLNDGLIAAGLTPRSHGRRTKAWADLEAATAVRSFRTFEGRWPAHADYLHNEHLPSPPSMKRLAGGTDQAAVERWSRYVLEGVGDPPLSEGEWELLRSAAEVGELKLGRGRSKSAQRLEAFGFGVYSPGGQAAGGNKPNVGAHFTISEEGRGALEAKAEGKPMLSAAPAAEEPPDLPAESVDDHTARRRLRSLPSNLVRRPIKLPPMERVQAAA